MSLLINVGMMRKGFGQGYNNGEEFVEEFVESLR